MCYARPGTGVCRQTVTPVPPRLLVLDGQHGLQNLHAANPAALAVTGGYFRISPLQRFQIFVH